ncbi:MAG: aminodeoxychorismate/anthranilate synthase component II [Euryarchaeota archaeon]|nr:aminodeoxychorismate/anthranilate synthase component II [Euryarchaeota archaeon]
MGGDPHQAGDHRAGSRGDDAEGPGLKLVLIDHQDSFVYNLAQALGQLGAEVVTLRSSLPLRAVLREDPDLLVLSPGPGHPSDPRTMGVTPRLLSRGGLARELPTLGVCLGHQAIGAAFGGTVHRGPYPCHGETSRVLHHREGLYEGVPSPFSAARYHSLVVDRHDLPAELEETSWEAGGVLMGLRHRTLPIEGVQFHPESYLTRYGDRLLGNFLKRARR